MPRMIGTGLAEARGEQQRQELSLVADLREGDNSGRDEQRIHERSSGPGEHGPMASMPSPGRARAAAKGLAKRASFCTLPAPWPKPSVLTRTPLTPEGGPTPQ